MVEVLVLFGYGLVTLWQMFSTFVLQVALNRDSELRGPSEKKRN